MATERKAVNVDSRVDIWDLTDPDLLLPEQIEDQLEVLDLLQQEVQDSESLAARRIRAARDIYTLSLRAQHLRAQGQISCAQEIEGLLARDRRTLCQEGLLPLDWE